MSRLSPSKRRFGFIPFWAALWLAISLPIQAAAAVALRAPQVINALNAQLKIIGPMAPSPDIAALLWATYSPRLADPNEAMAGQILMRAIERPDVLPRIAAALEEMTPGGQGAETSRRLDRIVGRYQDSPEALRVLQDMVAPLDLKLARSPSRRAAAKDLGSLSAALFDGTKRIPTAVEPPSSAGRYRVLSRGAATVGAGRRNFGLAVGEGGVQPSGITPTQTASLTARLEKMKSGDGPRVLTERELSTLHDGRAAWSNTLDLSKAANANFQRAALLVNRWAAEGKDLELGMLIELNRTLRRGIPSWAGASKPGKIRVSPEENVYFGGTFSLAKPDRVVAYLTDFLIWYRANESRLHPIHLAAESYQQLVRIHPFSDANGRTTRLIMDFILQRNGYLPAVFTRASAEAVNSNTAAVVKNTASGVIDAEKELSYALRSSGSTRSSRR